MKAITRLWHNGSPVLVDGYIENGKFVVTGVDHKNTPSIEADVFEAYQVVSGPTQFNGCQFRSAGQVNGEYIADYYIVPEETTIESASRSAVSDVLVGISAGISDGMPKEKSDAENDLIFGENNW